MSAKHTPGPWRVGRGGSVVCDQQHDGNHQMKDDDLAYYGGHLLAESIVRMADAHLIAAAPEQHEALQAAADVLNACARYFLGTGPQPEADVIADVIADAILVASAAIAKAVGTA